MRITYFPGCTLNTTAKGFDNALRASFAALGAELVELPEWNCCGATFPLVVDNILDLAAPTRVLLAAQKQDERLAVACTMCYNVIRRTNNRLRSDADALEKLNYFIEDEYRGGVEVLDVLQILRDDVGFEAVKAAVKKPLTGLKVAAYYGCMVLRPPAEVAYDDPENPRTLDDLLVALGAEPVQWPHKAECCGAYLAVKSKEATAEMSYRILSSARRAGAQAVVTNCPLCQFNLDKQQLDVGRRHSGYQPMPVFYFSQLLGVSLGLDTADFGWERHYVDVSPLLERPG